MKIIDAHANGVRVELNLVELSAMSVALKESTNYGLLIQADYETMAGHVETLAGAFDAMLYLVLERLDSDSLEFNSLVQKRDEEISKLSEKGIL